MPHRRHHLPDCIDLLVHQLALPDSLATLARYIHNTALPSTSDPYTAACALYVASIAVRAHQIPQLPLSRILNAASTPPPSIPSTMAHQHQPQSPTSSPNQLTPPPSPPHAPLARHVHLSHTAFMVSAHVWRKLHLLIHRNLLVNHPCVPRLPWLFFIVAKATISSPTDCNLTPLQAYHLLLACLLQSGFIQAPDPERALFRVTTVVPSELHHYKRALNDLLHKSIQTRLPFLPAHHHQLQHISQQLHHAYDAQLTNAKHRLATDERIFLHAPNLAAVGSPPISPVFSASPLNQQPSVFTTPRAPTKRPSDRIDDDTTPPPNRRPRLLSDNPSHPSSARPPTPARRPRSASHTPMSTPTRFSTYAASTRPDALDALATIAAVTPHSAASLPATPPSSTVPLTPLSDESNSIRWLRQLADTRPETRTESALTCPLDQVPTTESMRTLAASPRPLKAVIDLGRRYSDALCSVLKQFDMPHYKRAALAIYFYAIEGILTKEHRRLANQLDKFSANVLHNAILHKSFLTFAWETTAAAYGKKDLRVFMLAYRAFNVSPFELTKALDAFCTLVPQMPRSLVNHMISCDARILEWMAWRRDSPLVNVLQAYGRDRLHAQHSSAIPSASDSKQTPPTQTSSSDVQPPSSDGIQHSVGVQAPSPLREMERPERLYSDVQARIHVLDFFYGKVFALAGTRTEELLRRLDLTCLRRPVWRSIKYCLWCRWNLAINRHVDLIIMCVIYGVAKVQQYRLQFREIVHEYKQMEHTCDATFDCESAAVYRNIVLDDYSHLIDYTHHDNDDEEAADRAVITETETADIIRFYNKAFVPHMKQFILPIADERLPVVGGDGMEVDTDGRSDGDGSGREECGAGEDGEVALNALARAAVRQRGLRREEMFQNLGRKLMESPMRVLRTRRSPRRIGHIIVSPMSPSTRNMVANRQSSGRGGEAASSGAMTPGTRRLFSFGESPMRTLTPMDTQESEANGEHGVVSQYTPLSFDGPVAEERSAAFRREVQMIIGRSGREPSDEESEQSSGSERSSS